MNFLITSSCTLVAATSHREWPLLLRSLDVERQSSPLLLEMLKLLLVSKHGKFETFRIAVLPMCMLSPHLSHLFKFANMVRD